MDKVNSELLARIKDIETFLPDYKGVTKIISDIVVLFPDHKSKSENLAAYMNLKRKLKNKRTKLYNDMNIDATLRFAAVRTIDRCLSLLGG
jgi:2C-methyl-D-erythritol 2,4-cyclodiphosphate synthase